MAIYWYDAIAATNGDGSYANPWNGESDQPIADGDEVRVKSYSIDDMTEFTFTGSTVNSNFDITTDTTLLNVGDLIMFDDSRTCGYIVSKTSTYVRLYGHASALFVFERSVTNGLFRKIKPEFLSQVGYKNHHIRPTRTDAANTVYSDGWINETTRVTDKSYMTIHTSIKDDNTYLYMGNRSGGGNVIDFPNSCLIPSNGMYNYPEPHYTHSRIYAYIENNVNSNITIHQLLHGNNHGRFVNTANCKDTTMIIDYYSGYYGLNNHYEYNAQYDNCDITINNMHAQATYWYSARLKNNTRFTFRKMFIRGANTPMLYSVQPDRLGGNFTVTYDGEVYCGNTPNSFTGETDSNCTINVTNNFRIFSNWGATELTTLSYVMNSTTQRYNENVSLRTLPIFNNFSSTFTTPASNTTYIHTTSSPPNRHYKSPINVNDYTILVDPNNNLSVNSTRTMGASYLFTDRSTHETYEELSCPMRHGSTDYSFIVTKDETQFKNTSPSYKFYLQTFSTSYNADFFEKVIKIPVTTPNDTTEFTVSGWLKSDVGLFNQDDLETAIFADNGDSIYTEKPIISNVEAGWTRFLVSFTPGFSQLAELRIRMKPKAGAKAFWLSDVEIL